MSVPIWISHISDNAVGKNDSPALVQAPWDKVKPPHPTDMYGSPLQLRGSLGKHETGAPRVIVSALPFHHTIPYATAPRAMRLEISAPIFGSFDGKCQSFPGAGAENTNRIVVLNGSAGVPGAAFQSVACCPGTPGRLSAL